MPGTLFNSIRRQSRLMAIARRDRIRLREQIAARRAAGLPPIPPKAARPPIEAKPEPPPPEPVVFVMPRRQPVRALSIHERT